MALSPEKAAALRRAGAGVLVFIGLILAFILFLRANFPPAAALNIHSDTLQVSFSADRGLVSAYQTCLTVRWQVEGVQTVEVNGQPVVGSGQQNICVTPAVMPTMLVKLPDGSRYEYTLNIGILERSPLTWMLTIGAAAAFLWAAVLMVWPSLARLKKAAQPVLTRVATIVGAVVLIGVIAAVLFEAVLRFYFTSFGTELERAAYVYSAQEINQAPQLISPMPYVSYVANPDYPEHNRLGYRGPEIEIPKPDGVFRIVALGGSTTYSSATDSAHSYPSQLQDILRQKYGYTNVEVVNAGLIGYTSWDTLANFIFRVLELQPDLVIVYDGVNDVSPRAADPECYRGLNPLRGLSPTRGLWKFQQDYSPSVFYRFLTIRLGLAPNPTTLDQQWVMPMPCATQQLTTERIDENPPVYFERNFRNLIAVARANGVGVMFSTWTYNHQDATPSTAEYWRLAIDQQNDVVRRLAQEFDLPLYDLAETDFANDSAVWAGPDPIHMSPHGTEKQASIYAAFLDEQKIIPRPGDD